jgi:hypothetical protein
MSLDKNKNVPLGKPEDKPEDGVEKPTQKPLIEMSAEEYDKYMCEKYPIIFLERNWPMSKTCMCWGFDVGAGWYHLIDELCDRLDAIRHKMGVATVALQVKEKYGALRFYHSVVPATEVDSATSQKVSSDDVKKVSDIVHSLVESYGRRSDRICEVCGKNYFHSKISAGHWVYAQCIDCFKKDHPDFELKNNDDLLE